MAQNRTSTPGPDWHHTQDQPHVDVHRIIDHAQIASHDHLCHELVFVESGTAVHKTAEGHSRLRPGDVIVIRPQVWHAYQNPRRLTIVNCLVGTRLIRAFGSLLTHVNGAFELYRRRPRRPWLKAPVVLHARPAQRQTLHDRLETIMTELREQPNGWQAATAAATLDILVITARLSQKGSSPAQTPRSSSRTDQAVLDAVSLVESNYDTQIRMKGLADHVHLSQGHLSRHFARRMGMSPIEFMHRIRAEQACRLLRSTALPIADIAADVGYDEVAYFSRCFRKQIGQSPRQYRRAHG